MPKIINCECGEVVRADSDDELVHKVERARGRGAPRLAGRCHATTSSPWPRRARSADYDCRGPLLAARGVFVVRAVLALAQEARQLGGERIAGRDVRLGGELVDAALELLDVRRGLAVRR